MKTEILALCILFGLCHNSVAENVNFIVKADITSTNNKLYSGYFISSFPEDFKFSGEETLKFLKSSNIDSLFLSEIKIVSDGSYIYQFMYEYPSNYRFGIHDIKSIKIEKFIIDPQPQEEVLLKADDFAILKNKLNKIQFISCSNYNPRIPLHFVLISYSSDTLLKDYYDKTINYLKESAKDNNISVLFKNIGNLEKECKNDNIIFLKEMHDKDFFKFDNGFNIKYNLDFKVLNDF